MKDTSDSEGYLLTPGRSAYMSESKWTDERPTEPGEYWLSLHPDQRLGAMATDGAVAECRLAPNARRLSGRDRDGAWSMSIDDPMLDGAKWSRRETPADPFEVTG